MHETKQRLIAAGLRLLLERGYNALGVQDLLTETGIPKGSFYHHFTSKEGFALAVIDAYQSQIHIMLHASLDDRQRPPLVRVRRFFELARDAYAREGYLGCLLGGLGQELSGASDVFRRKIDDCLASVASRLAGCLLEARANGDLPPSCDPRAAADLLVNAWEGAALRSRLGRNPRPLDAMLDFNFAAMAAS
jgi:TetR/AcrR family transcriptional regulator, transcriptional repressor for nem operon